MRLLATFLALLSLQTPTSRVVAHWDADAGVVACTIPHHPENRWLTLGVEHYVASGRQLDGLPSDPELVQLDIPALRCEDEAEILWAYCQLATDPPASGDLIYSRAPIPCDRHEPDALPAH